MNQQTCVSTNRDVLDWDQHRHGTTLDQQTFLVDPYENAAGKATYGITAGKVAITCGNIAKGHIAILS